MSTKNSLGKALKIIRKTKNITQEDFSSVSSRTYISTIERGLYSPTVDKVNEISNVLNIHPLTLLALAFLIENNEPDPVKVFSQVIGELGELKKGIS